ncbi:DUF6172 family protein [Roseibacillus persicicus]|uniref:Uncharacterized protein n=1 Tax=Roseibacillus persicicus TaxID=454148 RepID=A0A918TWZ1_9BACT|nr:DUF6172 family protein [Roseibacillus persicicus]GHC64098.1 hypothetical protein GCM10007100_34670 [Roseibacillus persicicus]
MKKTFSLSHPKIKPARKVEAAKGEINKYLKRERGKKLPEGFDFWGFNCQFGENEESKTPVHESEIFAKIDASEKENKESFYLEILADPRKRTKKPKA